MMEVSGKHKKLQEQIAYILHSISKPHLSNVEKETFISRSTNEITDLLESLHSFIKNRSVDTVLHEVPDTGQLLGRLSISQTIRGCPELYSKTTQCIHGLWRANPQSSLERKASEWAMAQIKSTVCLPTSSYYSVCQLGITPHSIVKENINQITTHIRSRLKDKYKQRKQILLSSTSSQKDHIASDPFFMLIIPRLMNAPINSPLLSLWEDVIDVLTLYTLEDPSSKQICQDLTKSLQLDKGIRPDLTSTTCYKLWTYNITTLEQEVLFRIQRCTLSVIPSKFDDIWKDSSLIDVCTRECVMYTVVIQMLTTVLRPNNLEVLSSFLRCVWLKTRDTQDSLFLCDAYPVHYRQLVTLLSVHPEDIKPDHLVPHMKTLCDIFKSMVIEYGDTTELLIISLQFKHWYQKVVQYCFVCDQQFFRHLMGTLRFIAHPKFLSYCLELIACYNCVWYNTKLQSIKDVLMRIVLCLRPLLVKSTLCYTDVICVLSGNQVNSQCQMKDIIYQILLMFMYQASGGLNILSEIIQLVTASENVNDHLTCMIETHDQLNINFSKWTIYKLKRYKDILCDLMKKSEKDLHPDVEDATKRFID